MKNLLIPRKFVLNSQTKATRIASAFFLVALFCISPSVFGAMGSRNYTISFLTQNQGSGGLRKPETQSYNYSISRDALSTQPTGLMSSGGYSLSGRSVAPQDQMLIGLYINGDAQLTNTTSVTLGLICGHSSGCSQMKISDNGVSWSDPETYSPTKAWPLLANEGKRRVYAMFKNGLGEWSGMCSDSIILDMSAPSVSISPAGDTFMEDPRITLTASETATIYYTTDGTEPTTGSAIYNSPIILTEDATVKAFAEDGAGQRRRNSLGNLRGL